MLPCQMWLLHGFLNQCLYFDLCCLGSRSCLKSASAISRNLDDDRSSANQMTGVSGEKHRHSHEYTGDVFQKVIVRTFPDLMPWINKEVCAELKALKARFINVEALQTLFVPVPHIHSTGASTACQPALFSTATPSTNPTPQDWSLCKTSVCHATSAWVLHFGSPSRTWQGNLMKDYQNLTSYHWSLTNKNHRNLIKNTTDDHWKPHQEQLEPQ